MIVWIFPLIAITSVVAAYYIRHRLSGENLNLLKLYGSLAFNGLFAIPYLNIVENDRFMFLGHRPDIATDYPIIGWIALFSALAHAFALPLSWRLGGWMSKK